MLMMGKGQNEGDGVHYQKRVRKAILSGLRNHSESIASETWGVLRLLVLRGLQKELIERGNWQA